jgi:arylformamidase
MKITISDQNIEYIADLSKPFDISIPLTNTDDNPIAWYLDKPSIEPVTMGEWVGKVSAGSSSTNFNNISFNPHAHGTHTECLGHITHDFYSIGDSLKTFFFFARLITVTPEQIGGDEVITANQIKMLIGANAAKALVIRTQPNPESKRSQKYSHSNPPYLEEMAATYMRECGIDHLLIDLPSVDKEHDEGRLLAHKAFWNVSDVKHLNKDARHAATITEMIYVPGYIADGLYLLNLQIAPFVNDASPSKPVLYALQNL